jgi:hypothetical protein
MPLVKKPDPGQTIRIIQGEGLRGVEEGLRIIKVDHEFLVQPWEKARDRPDFKDKAKRSGGQVIGVVELDAPKAESATLSVWQLLDRGTRIRYMMLSEDWESKTQVGLTVSQSGRGHKLGLDLENPEGGIHKRDFAENIAKEAQPEVDDAVERGYDSGFQKAIGS